MRPQRFRRGNTTPPSTFQCLVIPFNEATTFPSWKNPEPAAEYHYHPRFQCGHGCIAVETRYASFTFSFNFNFQCGHGCIAVETLSSTTHHSNLSILSMWPRLYRRGNRGGTAFSGGGGSYAFNEATAVSPWKLYHREWHRLVRQPFQCGHGCIAVEIPFGILCPDPVFHLSMRPRLYRRGNPARPQACSST